MSANNEFYHIGVTQTYTGVVQFISERGELQSNTKDMQMRYAKLPKIHNNNLLPQMIMMSFLKLSNWCGDKNKHGLKSGVCL